MPDLVRMEERINYITGKMAECHRVIRAAEDAREELERLRAELRSIMTEYMAETEPFCRLQKVK